MSAPTGLLGHMDSLDVNAYGSVVDYLLENTPQLVHPESVRTFARMRHDPMLASVLQAYGGPIGRAPWAVDPSGASDEVTQRVADELGLPVAGTDVKPTGARRRRFTWAEHVRLVGLYRVFGHMFFEQSWTEAPGGWALDVVQERMPQTVAALHLNPDGTLKSVEQATTQPGKPAPLITTADHRLVYYTRQREGSNYFGESMLRACYGPWLIKDQMLRVHAETIRRFGMGIPEVAAPPNATPQQLAEAQRYAQRIGSGARAGAGVPAGFTTTWKGLQGSLPDALGFVQFLNQEMARSTLTMILVMAAAEKGNRSLGETIMDLLIMAQQADADFIATTGTDQLVIPLVDANFGDGVPAPRIVAGTVGADVETTAQDIYWLMAYGGLKADAPARAWIRQLRGMPAEDPTDPVFAEPTPTTPPPEQEPTPSTEGGAA